jgi:hypothetical protein
MKQLILICVLLISSSFFGQITTNEWKEMRSVSTESVSCWNVDAFNQLFVANQSTLIKYSTDGTILYKISDKSLGEIQQIIPVTPLKILLFSEMQQRICFVDNTLTLVDACIDLSDYEIEYASHIARSGRGDKLWVFDQINSRILLIDLNQKGKIIQEIRNTKGLIEIEQLIEMIEFDSKLYLLDNSKKLTVFDLYGSLIDQQKTETHSICSSDNAFWSIDSTYLIKEERENSSHIFNKTPLPDAIDFQVINNQYYFQEKNIIHIFEIVEKK